MEHLSRHPLRAPGKRGAIVRPGFAPRTQGFSLIEVLVSIVVLAFGMLGAVGLQVSALQVSREAKLQSSALLMARELAEMMRGNKKVGVAATNNPYLGAYSTPLAATSASYCLGVSGSGCGTGATGPGAVGSAEMTEWLARVDAELPGARVTVCLDDAPYDAQGRPQWNCTATGGNGIIVIKMGWTRASTDKTLTGSAALERTTDTASRPSLIVPVTPGNTGT